MTNPDQELRLELLRAAGLDPVIRELLERAAARVDDLSAFAGGVASARSYRWPSAADEAAKRDQETVWDLRRLDRAAHQLLPDVLASSLAPGYTAAPRDGSITFAEIQGQTPFTGSNAWDAYFYDRWSAAAQRNGERTTLNASGPIFDIGIGASDFLKLDGRTHATIGGSLGRQHGERAATAHVATPEEIIGFRRCVSAVAAAIEQDVRLLPFFGYGFENFSVKSDEDKFMVYSDETSSERSIWSISVDLGFVEPWDEIDDEMVYLASEWNDLLGKLMLKHWLRFVDELMDAGVFVRFDDVLWQCQRVAGQILTVKGFVDSLEGAQLCRGV